ncbi:hypothetical protein ES705_03572 [subsurface metagenome]
MGGITVVKFLFPASIFVTLLFLISVPLKLNAQISFPGQSQYRYLKGIDAAGLDGGWMNPGFNDSSWDMGNAPFRYGDGTGGTEIADMQNNYSTIYLRSAFEASNVANINEVTFTVDYDDGFVIWINGDIALSQYAPAILSHDAFATDLHESGTPESFVVSIHDLSLSEGENTIAVQGFNANMTSSDFYFDVSIIASTDLPQIIDTIGIITNYPSGFYSSPFNLVITSPDPEADIIYTLDGSNPASSGSAVTATSPATVYINPLSTTGRAATPAVVVRVSLTKEGFTPSIPRGRTYIFLDDVRTQSYPGGNWPNTDINGQIIDYDMDPDVVNDAMYSSLIDDALLDIPTLSVITDNASLFDPAIGIYVNAEGHGMEWERECTVELIHPDGADGFNVNAGLRIRGGWSRHSDFPKHAFRLFFRSDYGDPKLDYPLFDDEGVSEYDKIDLRTAQNYAWSNGDNRNTMVREVFSRDSQRDMEQHYTRSRYYHLYLNGMYWGIFQTQERSEARFASDYLGDSREDYDVVKVNTEDYSYTIEATDGYLTTWQRIYNLLNQGFSDNTSYFYLEGKNEFGRPASGMEILVDIDNLIDYMLTIFYAGNFDAPTSSFGQNNMPNNFYAIVNRNDKTDGYVFFNHDAEHAMFVDPAWPGSGISENRVNIGTRTDQYKMEVSNFSAFHPQWLHFKLTDNEEYRLRFADRAARHLTGDGVFTPSESLARFNSRVSEIETAIIAESARWGDAKSGHAFTKDDDWMPEIYQVQTEFFPLRTNILIIQLKQAGLYTSLGAPEILSSGNPVYEEDYLMSSGLQITIENPNSSGSIYYTLNGDDPRQVGGDISPSALEGNNGVSMNISSSAIIKARIYSNGNWSAIRHINFYSGNDDYSKLKVTELHYHPVDVIQGTDTTSGKSFEFIEFKNTGETSLNLSGFVLDSAVYYEFPPNTILGPKQFYVIVSKPSYFYYQHGKIASGNFKGNLSNGGEEVLLKDSQGNEIIHFFYHDYEPWPVTPDGEGPSLVSFEFNPTGNPNDPYYWRASYWNGGSPFGDDKSVTAIEETEIIESDTPKLFVYPNPTQGVIFVKPYSSEANKGIRVRIYTLSGLLLFDAESNNEMSINLNNFAIEAGIYILQVASEDNLETRRIIYKP